MTTESKGRTRAYVPGGARSAICEPVTCGVSCCNSLDTTVRSTGNRAQRAFDLSRHPVSARPRLPLPSPADRGNPGVADASQPRPATSWPQFHRPGRLPCKNTNPHDLQQMHMTCKSTHPRPDYPRKRSVLLGARIRRSFLGGTIVQKVDNFGVSTAAEIGEGRETVSPVGALRTRGGRRRTGSVRAPFSVSTADGDNPGAGDFGAAGRGGRGSG